MGSKLVWFHYWARELGMDWAEYHLLTTGQIEDLIICQSIACGAMDEVEEQRYIPNVR